MPLNSRQRTALAYLRKHEQMTNAEYCRLNSVGSVTATKDLKGLVDSGLVKMHGTRRWAHYRLPKNIEHRQKSLLSYEESILNQRQQAVMQYVRQNGRVTVPEFIHLTGETISERRHKKISTT